MTISDAVTAHYGQIFYHKYARNADKTAVRVRVSGRCKTWKTRPGEFLLPVKYGFNTHMKISDQTAPDFLTEDPTR